MPQAHFLLGLGIEARLEALAQAATPEQAEALRAGLR
jgi:SAM-dependent MidA family methyltransferase